MAKPSIYCVEGEWGAGVRDSESVLPILELLQQIGYADFVHRDVLTRRDLEHHLKKVYRTSSSSFPVVYIACHGEEGGLHLGLETISIGDLGRLLDGRITDRVLHLGGCSVMKASDDDLRELARVSGARAVVGYERDVDWLESASFDLLVLGRLLSVTRSDAIFNGLRKQNDSLAKTLGLVVATRSSVRRARSLAVEVREP